MARTDLGTAAPTATPDGARAVRPIQRIHRAKALPSSRAVVGGLLMALAATGVLVAYQQADEGPTDKVVVLARDVAAGELIGADDLKVVPADLPQGFDRGFGSVDSVAGRVALAPMSSGEIVQQSAVSDSASTSGHEIAITLPREQIAVGRLKRGERIDAYVTADDRTTSVVRGAEVVQIDESDDDSLTSDRNVSLVVAVPSSDAVAALVHALRTGDVTVVRSTFTETTDEDIVFPATDGEPSEDEQREG